MRSLLCDNSAAFASFSCILVCLQYHKTGNFCSLSLICIINTFSNEYFSYIWNTLPWNLTETQLHMVHMITSASAYSFSECMFFFFFHGVCRPSVIRSLFCSFVKVPLHEIIWSVSVPPWLIFSLSCSGSTTPLFQMQQMLGSSHHHWEQLSLSILP